MLDHFQKLNTPLKSVIHYPTVVNQRQRFSCRGWDSVRVWTLWQAWADEAFLSASERRRLDEIEPFDEWEEFALFASHYCVVCAKAGSNYAAVPAPLAPFGWTSLDLGAWRFDKCLGQKGQRRFAAAVPLVQDKRPFLLLNVLGLGPKGRLQSCDVYSLPTSASESSFAFKDGGPVARMCHSLTDLGRNGALVAGGRTTPSKPLRDCWLLDKTVRAWRKTHDLPVPLYRHAVTALGDSGLALLVGGRGENTPFDGCLLYHPELGWVDCEILGVRPDAVYGAVLSCGSVVADRFCGVYAGGLKDGLVANQVLHWELDTSDIKVIASHKLIEEDIMTM